MEPIQCADKLSTLSGKLNETTSSRCTPWWRLRWRDNRILPLAFTSHFSDPDTSGHFHSPTVMMLVILLHFHMTVRVGNCNLRWAVPSIGDERVKWSRRVRACNYWIKNTTPVMRRYVSEHVTMHLITWRSVHMRCRVSVIYSAKFMPRRAPLYDNDMASSMPSDLKDNFFNVELGRAWLIVGAPIYRGSLPIRGTHASEATLRRQTITTDISQWSFSSSRSLCSSLPCSVSALQVRSVFPLSIA